MDYLRLGEKSKRSDRMLIDIYITVITIAVLFILYLIIHTEIISHHYKKLRDIAIILDIRQFLCDKISYSYTEHFNDYTIPFEKACNKIFTFNKWKFITNSLVRATFKNFSDARRN